MGEDGAWRSDLETLWSVDQFPKRRKTGSRVEGTAEHKRPSGDVENWCSHGDTFRNIKHLSWKLRIRCSGGSLVQPGPQQTVGASCRWVGRWAEATPRTGSCWTRLGRGRIPGEQLF